MSKWLRYWYIERRYLVRDQRKRANRLRNWYYPVGITYPEM
jgi:hypothetical protein